MPPFKFLILRYLKIGQTKALWSAGEIDKKSFTWQPNLNCSDDENNLLIIRQQGPGHSFSRHNVTWQTCGHEHKQCHTNNDTQTMSHKQFHNSKLFVHGQ